MLTQDLFFNDLNDRILIKNVAYKLWDFLPSRPAVMTFNVYDSTRSHFEIPFNKKSPRVTVVCDCVF